MIRGHLKGQSAEFMLATCNSQTWLRLPAVALISLFFRLQTTVLLMSMAGSDTSQVTSYTRLLVNFSYIYGPVECSALLCSSAHVTDSSVMSSLHFI